jgi:hypothetical protein
VILEQFLLGIMVAALTLLLLPFLLVMAGVGAAMLLWFVVSAAVLGALIFWMLFPGTYGLAILLLVLVIGLLLVDNPARGSLRDARPPTRRLHEPRDGIDATDDCAGKAQPTAQEQPMSYYDYNPRRTPDGMATPPTVGAQIDAGLRAYMQRVYSCMAGGLAVTVPGHRWHAADLDRHAGAARLRAGLKLRYPANERRNGDDAVLVLCRCDGRR